MPDAKSKAFERRVAKRLGGRRVPTTGEKHGVDVDCGWLVVQCKSGYRMPSYLREWLAGIVNRADEKRYETIGAVVWRSGRQKDDDAVVVMRLKDFEALHGADV